MSQQNQADVAILRVHGVCARHRGELPPFQDPDAATQGKAVGRASESDVIC